MATRTAYPGTTSPGDVLTSANVTKFPGGLIGWAIITASTSGIGATGASIASLTVTVGSNRIILISAFAVLQQSGVDGIDNLTIKEGGTQLSNDGFTQHATWFNTSYGIALLAPSGGSHTYTMFISASAGTCGTVCSSVQPGWMLIEDLGPAF